MKILIHDYAGHPFQVQLSRELARRGHLVIHAFAGGLITPRGALVRRSCDPEGFRIQEVPMSPDYARNKYSFIQRRGFEVDYGRTLLRLVLRERPDVVLSGNTPTEPQWRLVRDAGNSGIPVISWVQDFYGIAVDKLARKYLPIAGVMAGWWYRKLDSACFQNSTGIVAISEDFVPILKNFGANPDTIVTIPNWAPLEELPVRPRRNSWSVGHNLDDCFVFHYSGTLAMKHNPDLLRQLAIRFRADPSVRVVVISEGPGVEWLRQKKRTDCLDNLVILPFQNFSEMPDVLAASDVLIAVLEAEAGVFSVPSKVLTYHCAGRPILGGIPAENLAARIVANNCTGLCVAPEDIDGFLTAAVRLRNEPQLCSEMGASAREYAEKTFDIGLIANRFEAFIKSVVLFGKK
jgi:colanic acid biosynthesis glycosyl transferase WcaI